MLAQDKSREEDLRAFQKKKLSHDNLSKILVQNDKNNPTPVTNLTTVTLLLSSGQEFLF